jgi:hypothetical protein
VPRSNDPGWAAGTGFFLHAPVVSNPRRRAAHVALLLGLLAPKLQGRLLDLVLGRDGIDARGGPRHAVVAAHLTDEASGLKGAELGCQPVDAAFPDVAVAERDVRAQVAYHHRSVLLQGMEQLAHCRPEASQWLLLLHKSSP